jgi:hypothetical protein
MVLASTIMKVPPLESSLRFLCRSTSMPPREKATRRGAQSVALARALLCRRVWRATKRSLPRAVT